jgi:hypothetical protein
MCFFSVKTKFGYQFQFQTLVLFSLTAYRNKGIPYTLAHTTIDLLHNTFANLWKFQCEPPHAHVLHIQWKSNAKKDQHKTKTGEHPTLARQNHTCTNNNSAHRRLLTSSKFLTILHVDHGETKLFETSPKVFLHL